MFTPRVILIWIIAFIVIIDVIYHYIAGNSAFQSSHLKSSLVTAREIAIRLSSSNPQVTPDQFATLIRDVAFALDPEMGNLKLIGRGSMSLSYAPVALSNGESAVRSQYMFTRDDFDPSFARLEISVIVNPRNEIVSAEMEGLVPDNIFPLTCIAVYIPPSLPAPRSGH